MREQYHNDASSFFCISVESLISEEEFIDIDELICTDSFIELASKASSPPTSLSPSGLSGESSSSKIRASTQSPLLALDFHMKVRTRDESSVGDSSLKAENLLELEGHAETVTVSGLQPADTTEPFSCNCSVIWPLYCQCRRHLCRSKKKKPSLHGRRCGPTSSMVQSQRSILLAKSLQRSV